jgi:hypothetical protein
MAELLSCLFFVKFLAVQQKHEMKVLGRRTAPTGGLSAAANLQQTLRDLRGSRKFIPRGVYRFKTHEEADEWLMKMLTR